MPDQDTYKAFLGALDVINKSLQKNRDKGVFGKLIEGFDSYADGHVSAVAIHKDDPKRPHDYFAVRYTGGRFELLERGKGEHDTHWKVSTKYLQSLNDDPQTYIDHPSRLDLDWMATILPDSVSALFKRAA